MFLPEMFEYTWSNNEGEQLFANLVGFRIVILQPSEVEALI